MSGQPIGPDGDMYEHARQRVALIVVYFMSRKNVIGSIADCEEIADTIVRSTAPHLLYKIVHGPDAALDAALIDSSCRALDLLGTAAMIQIYARIGNLGVLPLEKLGPIARRVLEQLETAATGRGSWVWPSQDKIESVARQHLSGLQIVDLCAIEHAVLQVAGVTSILAALNVTHLGPQPDERTTRIFAGGPALPAAIRARAGNDT